MIIVADLDGVVFEFTKAYAKLLIAEEGDKFPAGWQTSPDFPLMWDYDKHYGYSPEAQGRVWKAIMAKDSTFWRKLDPLPGATEAVLRLNELTRHNHQVAFLTHRMGYGVKYQTEVALYHMGMNYPTVILAEDKAPLLHYLKANVFIDDKPSTIETVAQTQIPNLRTFIKDAPYNRDCNPVGVKRVATIREMLEGVGLWS